MHGRGCKCGDVCDVHGDCAAGADVQHGNGDALCAVFGDGERRDQLRERVLHDGRIDTDDGFDAVHGGVADCGDDDGAGDFAVPGGKSECGDVCDVYGDGAGGSGTERRVREFCADGDDFDSGGDAGREGVLHD